MNYTIIKVWSLLVHDWKRFRLVEPLQYFRHMQPGVFDCPNSGLDHDSVILCNYTFLRLHQRHISLFWKVIEFKLTVASIIHSLTLLNWRWGTLPLLPVAHCSANAYLTSCLHKSWARAPQNSSGKWILCGAEEKVKQAWKMDERFWPYPSLYMLSLQNYFTPLRGYEFTSI